jgi:hypothetical protein
MVGFAMVHYSRGDIGGHFISHFSNLFTSSNPILEQELLDFFSPIIINEENTTLSTSLLKKKYLKH